ncbi:MAG TPA: SRPBCC family protein [bacterium]|nr:SRPBCC family protein [bacterium]
MEVTLNQSFTVQQPIERVWAFLSDPRKVAPCLPGAELLEAVNDTTYRGAIKMKLGPFSAQFMGEVVVEHMDSAAHEIRMVGKGKDSKGTGSAAMTITGKLSAVSPTATEMVSQSHLVISGKIAQFGARMVEDVSKSMFSKFTEAFTAQLQAEAEGQPGPARPADNAVKVTEVAGAVVKGAMGRLFGRGDKDPQT